MRKFIDVDRETPMLLPCDLREWVPEDDMVHFIIESVEGMKLHQFKVNERGTGSKQYPPVMMLALLIYSYANGIFGSRRIERATYRDITRILHEPMNRAENMRLSIVGKGDWEDFL